MEGDCCALLHAEYANGHDTVFVYVSIGQCWVSAFGNEALAVLA